MKKKFYLLRQKLINTDLDRNKTINNLKNKRIKALNELSKTVNKILAQYSVEKIYLLFYLRKT